MKRQYLDKPTKDTDNYKKVHYQLLSQQAKSQKKNETIKNQSQESSNLQLFQENRATTVVKIDQINDSRDILDISYEGGGEGEAEQRIQPSFSYSNEQKQQQGRSSINSNGHQRYMKIQKLINKPSSNPQQKQMNFQKFDQRQKMFNNKESCQQFIHYLKDEKRKSEKQYSNMIESTLKDKFKKKSNNEEHSLFSQNKKQKVRPMLPSPANYDRLIDGNVGQRINVQQALMFIAKPGSLNSQKPKSNVEKVQLKIIREEREGAAEHDQEKLSILKKDYQNLENKIGNFINSQRDDEEQQETIQQKLKKIYQDCQNNSKSQRNFSKQSHLARKYSNSEAYKNKTLNQDNLYQNINIKINMIESIVKNTKLENNSDKLIGGEFYTSNINTRRDSIRQKAKQTNQKLYNKNSVSDLTIKQGQWQRSYNQIPKNKLNKQKWNQTLPVQNNRHWNKSFQRKGQEFRQGQHEYQQFYIQNKRQRDLKINSPFNVFIHASNTNNSNQHYYKQNPLQQIKINHQSNNCQLNQIMTYTNNQISVYVSFNKTNQQLVQSLTAKIRLVNVCNFQLQDIFIIAYGKQGASLTVQPKRLFFNVLKEKNDCKFQVWLNQECINDKGFYLKISYTRSNLKRKINIKVQIPFFSMLQLISINEKDFNDIWKCTNNEIYVPAKQLQVNQIRWHENLKANYPFINIRQQDQSSYTYGVFLRYKNIHADIVIKIKCNKGGKVSLRMKSSKKLENEIQEDILNQFDSLLFRKL